MEYSREREDRKVCGQQMKQLYLECSSGISGDMTVAALLDLGADQEALKKALDSLPIDGFETRITRVKKSGLDACDFDVVLEGEYENHDHDMEYLFGEHEHSHEHGHDHHEHAHGHGHVHRGMREIREIIEKADLTPRAREMALRIFTILGEAEAKAHGASLEEVHFHEVGALDAVADVTGVCYAMYLLHPERVVVSPVHVGSGTVRCAHGIMPVPAPATAALLSGVPVYGGNIQGELCTPTGAALLVHFADSFGPMPAMISHSVGIGTGTKTFEQANCVRCFLGNIQAEKNGEITELVCNIDDMTPEALSFACSRLLELGALDVYTVPGTMKKGRPGHVLTVLCPPDQEEVFARHILAQTTTNGLRARRCAKYFLTPGTERVQTPWGEVRIKKAEGFGVIHRKPEYDDVAELARKHQTSCQKMTEMILSALEKEEPIS